MSRPRLSEMAVNKDQANKMVSSPKDIPATATTKKKPNKSGPNAGKVPSGDVRLVANIRENLHTRLKVEAAKQRKTIRQLIEDLIEDGTGSL